MACRNRLIKTSARPGLTVTSPGASFARKDTMARPPKTIRMRIKQDARTFLPDDLLHHADAANWLQSRIIRYAAMGMTREDDPTYVPLKRQHVDREIGWRAAGQVIPWLLQNGFLQRTSNYVVGRMSYGFKLGPNLASQPTFELALANPDLLRRIRSIERSAERAWGVERRHLKMWANRVSMNLADAVTVLQHLPAESRESVTECMAAISSGQTFGTFCEYGRAHTAVTRLKKELRPCLEFNGRRLVGIDIANSQPLILGATMRQELMSGAYRLGARSKASKQKGSLIAPSGIQMAQERSTHDEGSALRSIESAAPLGVPAAPLAPLTIRSPSKPEMDHKSLGNYGVRNHGFWGDLPPDLERFLELCEAGKLYDFLMRRTGWKRTKERWKETVWFRFLYGNPVGDKFQAGPRFRKRLTTDMGLTVPQVDEAVVSLKALSAAFRREFPAVHKWVGHKKRGDRGGLAKAMQRVESRIMIGGVVAALAGKWADVPFVTIHDCLLVLPEHVGLMRMLLAQEFGRIGVSPTVTEEHYSARRSAA
jgi:hypothetical protein